MNDYGLLEEYKKYSLDGVLKNKIVSKDIKALLIKITGMSKEQFYKEKKKNVYLYGPGRIGKTVAFHLLINHAVKVWRERAVYYITSPSLYNHFIKNDMWMPSKDITWVNFLASVRFLILDDLGQEYRSGSGFVETKIESFLRWRFNQSKITYIGTNGNFDSMETLYGKSFRDFIQSEYVDFEAKGNKLGTAEK